MIPFVVGQTVYAARFGWDDVTVEIESTVVDAVTAKQIKVRERLLSGQCKGTFPLDGALPFRATRREALLALKEKALAEAETLRRNLSAAGANVARVDAALAKEKP